jgi:hypothetical protein
MPFLRKKALIKSNVELWLNDLFLRDGLYTNVSTGETNFYLDDISLLIPVSDEDFADDRVFQSAFKNWVHESGIVVVQSGIPATIIASGVTVNGTFYPQLSGDPGFNAAFAHIIDYPNGRVIFDLPQVGSPIVQAQFSYKTVAVEFANEFNNEKRPLLIETKHKDNPRATGVDIYPTKESRTLPAVFIDLLDRQTNPYELGTRDGITDFFGVFHLWARDSYQLDLIEDILGDEHRQTLLGIDFNTAPFPLLAFGNKNPAFTSYGDLAKTNGAHFWRRIYVEETRPRKDTPLYEIERGRIDFNIRVYPNF